jgi:hypothetical protein
VVDFSTSYYSTKRMSPSRIVVKELAISPYCLFRPLRAHRALTRLIAGLPPRIATKDADSRRTERPDIGGETMGNINNRSFAIAALTALIVGLSSAVAIAGKSDGNYFEDPPSCCEPGIDLRTVCCSLDLSTADAAIVNGVLKLTTTTSYAIFTDGTNWVSPTEFSVSSLWSAAVNGEALRKDFSDWPTYRAKVWFQPVSQCTGYLAAYSPRGKLMVQKTFTSSNGMVLDTGALKGRIGYILASFDGSCGQLGKIGYYHNLH